MKNRPLQYGAHDAAYGDNNRRGKPEVNVRREGDAIVLPAKMTLENAIRVLGRKQDEEEQERCIQHSIHVSPHEGAIALAKALRAMFGFTVETENAGSDISVAVGVGKTMKVRWGRYDLPMGGYVETGTDQDDGRLIFRLHAHVQGKNEHTISALIERIEKLAADESPYRGKAFGIELTDATGAVRKMPEVKFLELPADPVTVIVRPEIQRDIDTCILGPIRNTAAVRAIGTPIRRGVLIAGQYGTGKTLTATQIAQICTQKGWTFIYLPKSAELPQALQVARQYEPCVLFVEDIDRVTGQSRTNDVNTILNSLDGITNKDSEVMVIFTTNHPGQINAAMRRPGRIDTAINMLPPDAATAERLLKHYAGVLLVEDQDLSEAGKQLDGSIPAEIREVVERAKLAVVSSGKTPVLITADDLTYAAGALKRERALFSDGAEEHQPKNNDLLGRLGQALVTASETGNHRGNGHVHVEAATPAR
ncbi:MAG: ATP-binding protein [Patescibacteria group bacterium]